MKIQPTQVVVIHAGVYATYINKEIQIAQTAFLTPTPILAVQPWAAEKNLPNRQGRR